MDELRWVLDITDDNSVEFKSNDKTLCKLDLSKIVREGKTED